MRITVVGGRLQGVEAVYLARMAGYESTVVDLDGKAPASGLCDRFICGDAADRALMAEICRDSDCILPALENLRVLRSLEQVSKDWGIPLIYDRKAYAISSSKLQSDRFFEEIGVPAPKPWPFCGYPAIAKPSGESGSRGVALLHSPADADRYFKHRPPEETVVQQYLKGPSYSVEVIGDGGEYAAFETTRLFVDRAYDCKRVLAPSGLSPELDAKFHRTALKIAEKLQINGIFDVEAILSGGEFYILEIDARLPSQTPTAVYHATGMNMIKQLAETAVGKALVGASAAERQACLYEHIHFKDGEIRLCGEHIMGTFGPLRIENGLWGADTVISSRREGAEEWGATLIYWGGDSRDVLERHRESMRKLRKGQPARLMAASAGMKAD